MQLTLWPAIRSFVIKRECARRLRCVVAAAAGLGFTPTSASASGRPALVQLEWSAPEECPNGDHVEREVERLLADPDFPPEPYLKAAARVHRERAGLWNVDLRTTGPLGTGQRTLSAESCVALADATALILALAIDPERVEANQSVASQVPTAPPQPILPPRQPETTLAPRSNPPRLYAWAADASATVDIGTLPATAPGVAAHLALIPSMVPHVRLEIGGAIFLDTATTRPAPRSGNFSLRTFDAGGCWVVQNRRLEFGGCADVELAWLAAEGLYESVTSSGDAEWFVLRVRGTVGYVWSGWAIRADLGAALNTSRPEFVSAGDQQGLIHQPARYTARGALGIEVRF